MPEGPISWGLADVLAMDVSPERANSLYARALAHLHKGETAAAERALHELALLRPNEPTVLHLQAAVALALHRPGQALQALSQVLKRQPGDTSAWFNLGQALLMVQDWPRAVQAFDKLLALQPDHAEAYFGRGLAWRALGQHGKAGKDASQALRLQPDHTGALQEQANAFLQAGAFDRALLAFAALEGKQPGTPFVACLWLFMARQLCRWGPLGLPLLAGEAPPATAGTAAGALAEAELAMLRVRAQRGEPALDPFSALVLYDDPALHKHVTGMYMHKLHPQVGHAAPLAMVPSGGRLRVAYVSSDFYNHATAYLLAGVLEAHDKSAVEVLLISYGLPVDDAMRLRLMQACDRWIDVHDKPDAEVAALCRELGVQVAVDLKGLTRDSRPGIFAHRAAPLQVNWLGYPGTLAAPYYDYMLADRVVVPETQRAHYSEAMAYLPHSYQPNDDRRAISPARPGRAEHGLPEGGLVMCCFNNSFKFTPSVWALWMRLLVQTPGSVLWLLKGHDKMVENLREQAGSFGVDPARLVFAGHLGLPEHLARLQLADLSLETLPCNAHTTASDALWAGVPHITCMGQSFASRVGASLLHAVGLPELVAGSMAEYFELAVSLLHDPSRLEAFRHRLASQRLSAPLFDTAGFASSLKRAFSHMQSRQAGGLAPEDFDVPSSADSIERARF